MAVARLVWQVQVAAVSRWNAWPALAGVAFHDGQAPDGPDGSPPAFPYVVLDTVTGTPGGPLGSAGGDATISGSVWCADPSNKGPAEILGHMEDALTEPLEMPDYNAAHLELDFLTNVDHRHARQMPFRFRIFTFTPPPP